MNKAGHYNEKRLLGTVLIQKNQSLTLMADFDKIP